MELKNSNSSNDLQPLEETSNLPQNNTPLSDEEKSTSVVQQDQTSTYILKYIRNEKELKEISQETGLPKSQTCLFMLNLKIIKENENKNDETTENYLAITCLEIAAVYFDEIYERIYSLNDLWKENKYFKVFEKVQEAKTVFDDMLSTNEKNKKKLFISFENNSLKLHMKLRFFDKEKEIILNVPKKNLSNLEKVNFLPEFLKEIQDKMIHLEEENKKLRVKKSKLAMNYNNADYKYEENDDEEEEDDKNLNNQMTYYNDNGENGFEKISGINKTVKNEETKPANVKNGRNNSKNKKLKGKSKKTIKTEENFF